MVTHLSTTATQALQLWLRADEPSLGWPHPGATVSAYAQPFNTWASMDQLVAAECWPDDDRPGDDRLLLRCTRRAVAARRIRRRVPRAREHAKVADNALRFVTRDLPHLLPGLVGREGIRWELLCGTRRGSEARRRSTRSSSPPTSIRQIATCSARPGPTATGSAADESGYDNLFLAGDWTDNGLNAGCIEAATLSGLQAANAILGRSRNHRIAGYYLR